jgi:hypothetical protein
MEGLRYVVFFIALLGFMVSIGAMFSYVSNRTRFAESFGSIDTTMIILFAWSTLSGVCNVLAFYWLETDERDIKNSLSLSHNASNQVTRLEGIVDDNCAVLDTRLKELEAKLGEKENT